MLEKIGMPVIPVTSKTFSEVLKLKNELNNNHPFITENGSAIYIPKSYFKTTKLNWKIRNDHFLIQNGYNRDYLIDSIQNHANEFLAEFKTFNAMQKIEGIQSIAKLAGLSEEDLFNHFWEKIDLNNVKFDEPPESWIPKAQALRKWNE